MVSFKAHETHLSSSLWARVRLRFFLFFRHVGFHCPRHSERGTDADCTSPLSCCAKGDPFLDFSSSEYGYGLDTGLMLHGTNGLLPVCWVIASVNMIPLCSFRHPTNIGFHTVSTLLGHCVYWNVYPLVIPNFTHILNKKSQNIFDDWKSPIPWEETGIWFSSVFLTGRGKLKIR